MKRISILLLTSILTAALLLPGCNLLNKADETEDQNALLLLLGAAWFASQSSSSCKNQSGLVICIPPGVPL